MVKQSELKGRIGLHILTRNRPEYLYGLLITIWRQTIKNWDLVIIDNSDDWVENYKYIFDIINRIRLEGHRVLVHRNTDDSLRKNIGGSRNIAIELDDCEFGCRIDDDSILEPDWLERQYKIIIKDEKIAAVGGLVPYTGVQYYRQTPRPFNPIFKDKNTKEWVFSDDGHFRFKGEEIIESHHLRSSFMFRNKVAREVGMHGMEYGSTGFREETDFCLKMINAGYKLYTDIQCLAWHMYAWGDKNREDKGEQKLEKQMMNEIHFRNKFNPMFEDFLNRGILECR
jgi:GT2 family glycosyltransferase